MRERINTFQPNSHNKTYTGYLLAFAQSWISSFIPPKFVVKLTYFLEILYLRGIVYDVHFTPYDKS